MASKSNWTRWDTKRPTDPNKMYRWRIPTRTICGMMLRPEWNEKLRLVGMGHDDPQYWPSYTSDWDGFHRYVPDGLEWCESDSDKEDDVRWVGLDLLPDPWTGMPPEIGWSSPYIGAQCFKAVELYIKHSFGQTTRWPDASLLVLKWNTRPVLGE